MITRLIVLEWLAIIIGAVAFLVLFGRPWRSRDRTMAWHITAVTVAAILEILGLLWAGVSLVPSVIAYGISAGIVWWRVVLLLRIRRKTRV